MTNTKRNANLEDSLSRVIPFSSSLTDSIVTTRQGDYLATWKIHGLSFEGLSDADAYAKMQSLNMFVRSLSNGKFAFWVHRVRRYVSDRLSVPENGYAKDFLNRYYDDLSESGMMATEIYLTVVYRPYPQGKGSGIFSKVKRGIEDIRAENINAIEELTEIDRKITATLDEYNTRLLGVYTQGKQIFSEQLEFYSYLINGFWWQIPAKDLPLYNYLPTTRHLFGDKIIESRDTYGSTYSTFVDIKDYCDFSSPGVLNTLLGLNCEYVETHSFSPMTKLDSQAAIKRQQKQLISSEDDSLSQIEDLNDALDQLVGDNISFGLYHYSLQLKGNSVEQVTAARSQAIELLSGSGSGFLGIPIDLVVADAYAAQLPSNFRYRHRVAKLSSRNFTGLCSFHNFASGKRDNNPFGEAVAILRSPSEQPVYFNFHHTPANENSFGKDDYLGNTQVIGKSGSGKTALAIFLLANLLKYKTQIVYFDKDRGAEIAIRRFGGQYLSLVRGEGTGCAPFKLEPTTENILFWEELVIYCSKSEALPHTPAELIQIHHAVNAVAQLPVEHRNFDTLLENLPDDNDNSISQRLRKWSSGGSLGWCLNSDKDIINFEPGRPYGFDYTEVLDNPEICGAVMMYLMFRVEKLIDGRKFAFFMDEYWKALSVSYFKDFAKNKQKTIRKQNGFGVYMTQSPEDTLKSDIARALIEQSATLILLPNPRADYDDYVNGFKLTETEYEIVKSLNEKDRVFLIKQEHTCSLAKLDLNGFPEDLKIISGTTANVNRLDKLRKRLGDDPEVWHQPFVSGES